jgi:hypothetical protein
MLVTTIFVGGFLDLGEGRQQYSLGLFFFFCIKKSDAVKDSVFFYFTRELNLSLRPPIRPSLTLSPSLRPPIRPSLHPKDFVFIKPLVLKKHGQKHGGKI